MSWIKKLFGIKDNPKKEEVKNSRKSISSDYSRNKNIYGEARGVDDYSNSLINPLNVSSPLSPLNPINQMNTAYGMESNSTSYDYTPSHSNHSSSNDAPSYENGSNYSSGSGSTSYDSGSSYSSDSSSSSDSGSW